MKHAAWGTVLLLALAVGCGDDTVSCPVGSEGCPCTSGGACDGTLVCASNLCVDLGADADADAAPDDGEPAEDADAVADEGEAGADGASEDGGDAAPACGPDLIPGERVCARGRAANFIDILPLPGDSADPPLQVQIKDLISSLGDPTANLAEAVVGADGAFLAPSFDLAETPARTLVLLVGEDEAAAPEGPGMVWQRSFGGMVRTDTTTTVYELPTVYAVLCHRPFRRGIRGRRARVDER